MSQPKIQKRAAVVMNGEFINIRTRSGYFNFLEDSEAPEYFLSPKATEEEIGRALLDALSHSRILNPKENRGFFSTEGASQRYEEWVNKIMERYKYKTRRAMFVNMKRCSICSQEGQISFRPTNHVKLEAWGRDKNDGIEDVVIPATSSAFEVGAALKEAFKRCG